MMVFIDSCRSGYIWQEARVITKYHHTSRLEVSGAIEPGRNHSQMSSRRPSCDHYPVHIDRNPATSQDSLQSLLQPCVRIAYVCNRASKKIDIWTELIVDADRQDVVGKKKGRLERPNGFLGECHMSATMDHQN